MKIQSALKTYDVTFVDEVLADRAGHLRNLGGRRFFFVDANVWRLYGPSLTVLVGDDSVMITEALESNKEYLALAPVYQHLIDHGFTKKDTLITIGGGILQDLSGFVASTLLRGIRWVFLPTTLLAQADSCIGSKTSINFGAVKNLVGTYYPPDRVLIDTAFCDTLTPQHFNSGLGEVLKFHLMAGEPEVQALRSVLRDPAPLRGRRLTELVEATLRIKHSYFRDDEFDGGRRNLCNYGHCFGHALESATNFEVPHGEAVIVGMAFANRLARARGRLDAETFAALDTLCASRFPRYDVSRVSADDILRFMRKDKKRAGADLSVILLERPGALAKQDDVSEAEVREAFESLAADWPALAGSR